jgi:hypothetical protein
MTALIDDKNAAIQVSGRKLLEKYSGFSGEDVESHVETIVSQFLVIQRSFRLTIQIENKSSGSGMMRPK